MGHVLRKAVTEKTMYVDVQSILRYFWSKVSKTKSTAWWLQTRQSCDARPARGQIILNRLKQHMGISRESEGNWNYMESLWIQEHASVLFIVPIISELSKSHLTCSHDVLVFTVFPVRENPYQTRSNSTFNARNMSLASASRLMGFS